MPLSTLTRLWTYQSERFPLFTHSLLVGVLTAASLSFSALARDADRLPPPALWLAAFATGLGFFLQLRIYDEFKDYADDVQFRPYRPAPRGLVTLGELAAVGLVAAGVQLGTVLWLAPTLLPLLLLVWLYMALMGKEFFVPTWLKAHPLVYMLSHMVITPLIVLYLTAWEWRTADAGPPPRLGWFLAVGFFNGMVFEIGRKIRAPEDEETGVETYSALWGRPAAVAAWLGAMALAGMCAAPAVVPIGANRWTIGVGSGLLAIGGVVGLRFLRKPAHRRSKRIEVFSAIWLLLLYLGFAIAPWL